MKIGILSEWYDPERGGPAVPGIYAREFSNRGHSVKVLTGFPNYPFGRVYSGYQIRPRITEILDGIPVTRVALYPSHGSSAAQRLATYGSFALSASVLGAGALGGAEGVWVYNSPATICLPMLTQTRFGHTPIFLHVLDLWPDSVMQSGVLSSGTARRIAKMVLNPLIRFMERRAATLGVSSPSLRDTILSRNPSVDPEKIVYLPHPVDERIFRPIEEVRVGLGIIPDESVFELMYAGSVGDVQGLDVLLDAAKLLGTTPEVKISIVGDGISRGRLEERVHRENISNVTILGSVSPESMPRLLAATHAHFVGLAQSPFLEQTTPSKIATLLASGVPIVGCLAGDGAQLINDSGGGVVVEPGDVVGLAQAITDMANGGMSKWRSLGRRGRDFYESHLSTKLSARRVVDSFRRGQELVS